MLIEYFYYLKDPYLNFAMTENYNNYSNPQLLVHQCFHDNYLDEILNNYDKNIIQNNDPFYIADLGCSGGQNSIPILTKTISKNYFLIKKYVKKNIYKNLY